MALDRDPNHVFRDFVTDRVPSSGNWNPRKPEIRQLLTEWWQTLIALVADAGGLELPNLLIRYDVTGGDENNIVAEANLLVPSGPGVAVFSIVIEEANTGPVTINGKPLLSNTGNPLVAGALAADGIYLFLDNGDSYRLLSDYVSAAIVAAAEAAAVQAIEASGTAVNAAERAETFAAGVEFPVSFAPQTLSHEQQEQARENVGALSYDEQDLAPAQRQQARANIAAVSYDEQTLTPEQQAKARANIGVASITSARATVRRVVTPSYAYNVIHVSGGSPFVVEKKVGPEITPEGAMLRRTPRQVAKLFNVPVATNADLCHARDGGAWNTDEWGLSRGLQIADGVAYRDWQTVGNQDFAFIMLNTGQMVKDRRVGGTGRTAQQWVDNGALWSVSGTWFCVEDGIATSVPDNSAIVALSARTIFGQKENGDYVFIFVEGVSSSSGIGGGDIAALALDEGCYNALTLDGGGSSQCWWGDTYAQPTSDEMSPNILSEGRATAGWLVINVPSVEPYDSGIVPIPAASGVSANVGAFPALFLRQIGPIVHMTVNASVTLAAGATVSLTGSPIPPRFVARGTGLMRGAVGGGLEPVMIIAAASGQGANLSARNGSAASSLVLGTYSWLVRQSE